MHIPDGLVSPSVYLSGYGLSLALFLFTAVRNAIQKEMARISLVAAVVFVSSLIHIPMGFTSVHLTFTGLAGVLLGPLSFIAVSMAVFLQWLLLSHGGITTLGVNAFTMGSAALLAYLMFYGLYRFKPPGKKWTAALAVGAGMLAAMVKVVAGSVFLIWGGFPVETFFLILLSHIPVIIGEGLIAGFAARYLLQFSLNRKERKIYEAA